MKVGYWKKKQVFHIIFFCSHERKKIWGSDYWAEELNAETFGGVYGCQCVKCCCKARCVPRRGLLGRQPNLCKSYLSSIMCQRQECYLPRCKSANIKNDFNRWLSYLRKLKRNPRLENHLASRSNAIRPRLQSGDVDACQSGRSSKVIPKTPGCHWILASCVLYMWKDSETVVNLPRRRRSAKMQVQSIKVTQYDERNTITTSRAPWFLLVHGLG